jgi:cytochrome c oxidase subunit III
MSRARLGVLFFILSEVGFFGMLIIAYVALHNATPGGPTAARNLDVARTGCYSFLLLSSSLTVWLAERAERRGRVGAVRGWLGATILLGGVFLVGQSIEYYGLLVRHVDPASGLFATCFFTLTGFHGCHVLAGLAMLGTVFGLDFHPRFRRLRGDALGSVSLYWHFVDAVWIAVFSVVYLRILS